MSGKGKSWWEKTGEKVGLLCGIALFTTVIYLIGQWRGFGWFGLDYLSYESAILTISIVGIVLKEAGKTVSK